MTIKLQGQGRKGPAFPTRHDSHVVIQQGPLPKSKLLLLHKFMHAQEGILFTHDDMILAHNCTCTLPLDKSTVGEAWLDLVLPAQAAREPHVQILNGAGCQDPSNLYTLMMIDLEDSNKWYASLLLSSLILLARCPKLYGEWCGRGCHSKRAAGFYQSCSLAS